MLLAHDWILQTRASHLYPRNKVCSLENNPKFALTGADGFLSPRKTLPGQVTSAAYLAEASIIKHLTGKSESGRNLHSCHSSTLACT